MAIYANDIIQDALSLVDVVSPGEAADPWFGQLAVRLLNGMLSEWALKGYYNPTQTYAQYTSTGAQYYTMGIDDSLVTISNARYTIVATPDIFGTYYQSISNDGAVTKYSVTGTGTRYSLIVNESTTGDYYPIAGGYSQKIVGDIPFNFAQIDRVQVDIGQITYNPKQVTMAEYMSMSVKQISAPPSVYAWDFQQPISKLYFWPRPLTSMTIRIVGSTTFNMVVNEHSDIPLDRMCYSALLYNLAAKIYPFLKRDNGIDQEIIYQARSTMAALRSRKMAMTGKNVVVPYGSSGGASSYWTSTLNTVTGSN